MTHLEYFRLADPDTILNAMNVCPDKLTAQLYAAELTYVYMHAAVPEWATVLETFEKIGDSYLFVQRDPDKQL